MFGGIPPFFLPNTDEQHIRNDPKSQAYLSLLSKKKSGRGKVLTPLLRPAAE